MQAISFVPVIVLLLGIMALVALGVIILLVVCSMQKQKATLTSAPLTDFSFALKDDQSATIAKLKVKNQQETPESWLDDSNLVITFLHQNTRIDYQLSFVRADGVTYMNAHPIKQTGGPSQIPRMINWFFVSKLDATPMDHTAFCALQDRA